MLQIKLDEIVSI